MTRVLVVDDTPDILGFIRAGLERAGYVVDLADNGREALARQREQACDVLITDIFMPEAEGLETIDRFRAEFPATRIIAMSGGRPRLQDYLGVARAIGADAALPKPFGIDELLRTLRKVL